MKAGSHVGMNIVLIFMCYVILCSSWGQLLSE